MKAIFTFYFWLQSLWMTVFLSVYISYREDSVLSWQAYLLFAVSGLLYGWLCTWLFGKVQATQEAGLLGKEVDLGEEILSKGCMNHFRGIIADGGVGYLLRDKLVFIPHKLNFSRAPVNLPYAEIKEISAYKILGVFDTG
ncbi:MAG: hypothetical protein LBK47_09760, partial [Prevotellaceae bacterium]|nr:hypothetical protein [Prevotellaceae bacterium]